jgi:hypothetical protein
MRCPISRRPSGECDASTRLRLGQSELTFDSTLETPFGTLPHVSWKHPVSSINKSGRIPILDDERQGWATTRRLLERAQEIEDVLLLRFRQTVEELNRSTGLVGTGRRWIWTVVCDCRG